MMKRYFRGAAALLFAAGVFSTNYCRIPVEVRAETLYKYTDEMGEEQETEAVLITNSTTELTGGKCYIAVGEVSLSNALNLKSGGEVRLILADDCKLSIKADSKTLYSKSGTNLSIYGQEKGTGVLNVEASKQSKCLAVDSGNNNWNFTVNGGNVNLSGYYGVSSDYCTLTLNGGNFYVNSENVGINVSELNVNGGSMTVEGMTDGINGIAADKVSISGGSLKVGKLSSVDITLGNAEMCIDEFGLTTGVKIAEGVVLCDKSGNEYSGTLNEDQLKNIIGCELSPKQTKYKVTWKNYDGTVLSEDKNIAENSLPVYDGETPVRQADEMYTYTFSGWDREISPATEDAVYTAVFTPELKNFSFTLPENMEIISGTVTEGRVSYGTEVKFAAKSGYSAENVAANGALLTEEKGVYTLTVTENTVVTAAISLQTVSKVSLEYCSVSLLGDIGINFYMKIDEDLAADEDSYLLIDLPSEGDNSEVKQYITEARIKQIGEEKFYIFNCHVSAKEMTSVVKVKFISGDYESKDYEYTVKKYADYLLDNADNVEEYRAAAPLVRAMLNYGAASQAYFENRTDEPANASLTESESKVEDAEVEIDDISVDNLPEGLEFSGLNLRLESETIMSLYFKNSSGQEVSFLIDGVELSTKDNNGYLQVDINNIKANEIGKIFEVKAGGGSVKCSPLNYLKIVLSYEETDAKTVKLKNVCKAMYAYYKAAKDYLG